MYRVRKTPTFDKDFKKLDADIARRILKKIKWCAHHPQALEQVRYLPEDLSGLMKCRVGDWRILLWADHVKEELILYCVDHRREIYKRLER